MLIESRVLKRNVTGFPIKSMPFVSQPHSNKTGYSVKIKPS